jgi:hypothetical protein
MIGGNNGIMQPGATLAPGRAGQAFDFDGNGGRIQVVTPSASLNLRGALTIDAWIMPSTNAMSSEETIVRNGLNTDELYALYCSPQGALSFEWYDGSSFQEISSRTLLIPSNQWNYVTVTKTDTNTVHLYLNGREVAQGIATSPTSANPNTLCIGSSQPDHGGQDFQGLVDEVRIFNRTLSAGEIQTNYNNATGGDCDDSSVSSPSGLIGWWPGDGDASDLWSTNNGTLVNGATFAPGGIGECFSLSGSNYVQIGASPSLDMSNALSFSFEAWVYPTGPSGGTFVSKENEYAIGENANGMIQWRFANNNFNWAWYTNGFFIPTNQWTHVAVVYDQGTVYTYANARLVSKTPGSGPIENFAPGQNDFRIGARQQTGEYFQGLIDEVSIYNQALSMPEIQTIYYAGSSGKSKGAPCIRIQPLSQVTPAGTNVTLTIALTNGEVPAVIEPLGTNVTFTVEAAGMIPLTYQWFFGGTNLLGDFDAANLLVGQTNSSLQLTNVTWRNMGNYWIAVSNRFGPDISSPALLVVWDTNDDDHDGLPNYWEVRYGLNPTNASDAASYPPGDKLTYFQKYFYGLYDFNLPLTNDTDGDGISDYCELFEYGTNPFTNNTAGDGIPDGWKVAHGLNPMINDANDIVDGVSNWQIYQYDLTNTFQLNPSNPFFAPGTSIYEVLNNGQHTNHYYYDGNDRLLGMESSRGISIGYQYDGNGNLAPASLSCPAPAETNGLPVLWLWLNASDQPAGNRLRQIPAATAGTIIRNGWRALSPNNSNSVPNIYGLSGTNVATLSLPFTPSNFVVGVGQLYGNGVDNVVVGADGNPGNKTNSLFILSETFTGWTTQQVNIGSQGVTSIAIGQPSNTLSSAIYVGLRQSNGTGSVAQVVMAGTNWVMNTIATSTNDAAFVLGVRSTNDLLVSVAATNAPDGSLFSLSYFTNWNLQLVNTNISTHQGLGIVGTLGSDSSYSSGIRLLDGGGIDIASLATLPNLSEPATTNPPILWNGVSLATGFSLALAIPTQPPFFTHMLMIL